MCAWCSRCVDKALLVRVVSLPAQAVVLRGAQHVATLVRLCSFLLFLFVLNSLSPALRIPSLSRLCLKSESVSVSVFVACVLLWPSFIHPSLTLSHESHEVGVRGCAVIGFWTVFWLIALVQQHEGARRARRPEVCLLPPSRSSCSCVQGPAGALTYRWLEDSDALHEMVAIADAVCKVRCVFARACARPCTCSSACGLHSTAVSAHAGRAVQT